MAAISGNMALNYGMDRPEILSVIGECSFLFLNNLSPIFGKEKQYILHLPHKAKCFTNYFTNLCQL